MLFELSRLEIVTVKARTHGATFLSTLRETVAEVESSYILRHCAQQISSCDTPEKTLLCATLQETWHRVSGP